MAEIVVADIGGTNARFCRAHVAAGECPSLGPIHKYKVADFPSLQSCWAAFARDMGANLPHSAAIAFAAPLSEGSIKLTNSNWIIRPDDLPGELGLTQLRLLNDFEAVAHAVAHLPSENLESLFGPSTPLPSNGVVTILGPGTGLGVAMILFDAGMPHIIATEGGHLDFAPLDAVEDRMLEHLRGNFRRVSVERIVSGPGLNTIYQALALQNGDPIRLMSDADLWSEALAVETTGANPLARAALDRLCMTYGSVAGDLALAHGAKAVVLVGGLTARMQKLLGQSGFYSRFTAKGRYEALMSHIPVSIAHHDEIGLFGAAAAFGAET